MKLLVLSPAKEIFNGDITSVKVPGVKGHFEILNGHAPIVSSLSEGEVRIITSAGKTEIIEIKKGFIEVLNNEVSLLVQVA